MHETIGTHVERAKARFHAHFDAVNKLTEAVRELAALELENATLKTENATVKEKLAVAMQENVELHVTNAALQIHSELKVPKTLTIEKAHKPKAKRSRK